MKSHDKLHNWRSGNIFYHLTANELTLLLSWMSNSITGLLVVRPWWSASFFTNCKAKKKKKGHFRIKALVRRLHGISTCCKHDQTPGGTGCPVGGNLNLTAASETAVNV